MTIKIYAVWIGSIAFYLLLLFTLGWKGLVGIVIGMVIMFFVIYSENQLFFLLLNKKQQDNLYYINRTWLKKKK